MNIVKAVSTLMMTMLFLSNSAFAEGEKLRSKLSKGAITITSEVKGCDTDAEKLCPGLTPGSHNAFMCLMAYESKLSDSCHLGLAEAALNLKMGAAAINYSAKACEADADKYCLEIQPGEGRIVGCLKKHQKKVSNLCISALKETGLWEMGK